MSNRTASREYVLFSVGSPEESNSWTQEMGPALSRMERLSAIPNLTTTPPLTSRLLASKPLGISGCHVGSVISSVPQFCPNPVTKIPHWQHKIPIGSLPFFKFVISALVPALECTGFFTSFISSRF